jgi:hypothetical protein
MYLTQVKMKSLKNAPRFINRVNGGKHKTSNNQLITTVLVFPPCSASVPSVAVPLSFSQKIT